MKHYSGDTFAAGPSPPTGAGAIARLVFPCSCGSPTPSNRGEALAEDELVAQLRARLAAAEDRHALARELGMSPYQLQGVLRGRWPIDDELAARLGYRRITRFERIGT